MGTIGGVHDRARLNERKRSDEFLKKNLCVYFAHTLEAVVGPETETARLTRDVACLRRGYDAPPLGLLRVPEQGAVTTREMGAKQGGQEAFGVQVTA